MFDHNNKEHIDEIVKARTFAIQKAPSNLVRRGIQDIERLTTDSRVSELIKLMDSSSDWKGRELVWLELRKMGPTYRGWAESLLDMLYSGEVWCQIFSAEALSRFSCNAEDAVPVLRDTIEECLDLKDYDGVRLCCLALGNYGNLAQSALPVLAPLLERRDDPLWQTYFDTAQKIDPRAKSGFDASIVSLSSKDADTRWRAISFIAGLGNAGISAIPELLSFVNDEDLNVRLLLPQALRQLGQRTSEIVNVLNTLTHDPDDLVKLEAFVSLVYLGENQLSNFHRILGFLSHNDPGMRAMSAARVPQVGYIDRESAISCLTRAIRLEENAPFKNIMAKAIEKIERCEQINPDDAFESSLRSYVRTEK